ncbi:hypothetical protein DFR56_11574 [Pseudogracilibacillus auburnensis]|uniref:Uncharacterized protein n=1 Tax=Pseudogracilibacillus auburnensis TaxID=1494959 RepID=A0A2V3VRX6_9BACI|nr:hypothetical protein DFR56_11574 [Pseudogracilibacillus auburnensis]
MYSKRVDIPLPKIVVYLQAEKSKGGDVNG